jgi:hypothetical protein
MRGPPAVLPLGPGWAHSPWRNGPPAVISVHGIALGARLGAMGATRRVFPIPGISDLCAESGFDQGSDGNRQVADRQSWPLQPPSGPSQRLPAQGKEPGASLPALACPTAACVRPLFGRPRPA